MNLRNILMFAVIPASLAVSGYSDAMTRPSVPARDACGINRHSLKSRTDKLPAPGIYKSEPFSCIVIVPESVDPGIEHWGTANAMQDNSVVRPFGHLVPMK